MERKFLEELGLEKEVINKVLDAHSAGIGKHKSQIDGLTGERDTLKTQLADVAAKLGAFDGVDLEALKKEINTLKGDIAKKETDFQAQLSDRDFQTALNAEITAAKGKSPKAIMAMLNIDTLKASKNQKEDVAAALTALRSSDAYLFEEAKTPGTPAKVSSGGSHDANGDGSTPSTNAQMNALITGKLRGEQ